LVRQALDYSQRDGRGVDAEVAAERGSGIGEAEAAGGDHVALLGPAQDLHHELPGADAAGVVDDRIHGVKPLLRLGWIRISNDWGRDLAVEEVTLQLRGHDGALLSGVS
jgi:hypothetical protein